MTTHTFQVINKQLYAQTIEDLCDAIGICRTTYRVYRRQGCPEKDEHGYPVTAALIWVRENIWTNGDSMMTGESSPALERYRNERARISTLERIQTELKLVSRVALQAAFGDAVAILRNAADAIGRDFGAEAKTRIDEALDEIETKLKDI